MATPPRSLLARVTLLVVAVVLLSLVVHVFVVGLLARPLTAETARQLGQRVELERQWLAALPEGARDAWAAQHSDERHRIGRGPGPPLAAIVEGSVGPMRVFEEMRRSVGPDMRVVMAQPARPERDAIVRYGFDVDGQPWHVEQQLLAPIWALVGTGVGWLALIAVGVGASLWLGMRTMVRPLTRVTEQIQAQRGALALLDVPSGASSEVRTLVDSFNSLAHAVRDAEAVKQQLLAGVSHDLRTPLARLRLRVETECEPALGSEVTDPLQADLRALERIVSQFLAYVQGGGAAAAQGSAEPAARVVSRVLESYVAQGMQVSAELDDSAADFALPDVALHRLLGNLIDNAIAHGGAPVAVSLAREGAAGVRLVVWDPGRGMTEDEFAQAQRPFVRLAGANTALGHCGLGLAIVAQIARQTGATLACERDAARRFGIALRWPAP